MGADDMEQQMIETRLVYGFLDAGKTSWIQDCILNDYFHKYGTTLILCFEQGEAEYDVQALQEKRTYVAYYEGETDIAGFCRDRIEEYRPDRIYVEMNTMMPGLREQFPENMHVTYVTTWIDWTTMKLYFVNFLQMINQMVSQSHQVTFRGCPSKELLAPYSQAFQLMNRKAVYLRQDPMGYHEKAFDLFLPYSLEDPEITITRNSFLPLWLDASEHPEHYEGKTLVFSDPLELRRRENDAPWSAGRVVMTCCMADLQFMGFELTGETAAALDGGWICFRAVAQTGTAEYGRRVLKLSPVCISPAKPPKETILSAGKENAGSE